jgi:hypothetical protein
MRQITINLIRYPGFAFMIVSTIMFYNHLFTAASNKGFFVPVYFNLYSEGLFELIFFIIALPFIWITIALEFISLRREKDGSRSKRNS